MLVDKILGNYNERYFGLGHKQTTYSEIFDLHEEAGDFIGYVALHQDSCWSKKKDVVVTPHLSSLDGIVLAVLMVEKYLEKMAPWLSLDSLLVESFEIKAGATPIEDLNRIPVKLKKMYQDKETYAATIHILNMKINLSLRRYDLDLVAPETESDISYVATHLKSMTHDLTNIDLLSEKYANCDVVRQCISKPIYSGISSRYSASISIFEWLIIVSQFAQVMAYNFDKITRCDSDTLWMRTIKAEIKGLCLTLNLPW
ncbi:AvrD family protein [Pseudolactococcus piscium]|nr:AvrD family protein [Lactococcus piscium]